MRELAKIGVEPSGRSLTEAVAQGNAEVAGWLLDVGVHTEHRDAFSRTPLRITIDDRNIELATQLIEHQSNVNAETPDHRTILGVAVEQGQATMVERLLAAGARPEGVMSDGEKILPWAIREGRFSFVRAMMKAGADPHARDRAGNPLLHVAMKYGRRDLMESLLEFGADPGEQGASGESVMEIAIRQHWYDLVPKLAQAGADPNIRCFSGRTPLEKAIEQRDLALVAAMLQAGADVHQPSPDGGTSPWAGAIVAGDEKLIGMFLENGCKLQGDSLDISLWQAFSRQHVGIARQLLKYGAPAKLRDSHGHLMVEAAVLAGDADFVKLLLDYCRPAGRAMEDAALTGRLDMAKLLVACGVPFNSVTPPFEDTPLMIAVRSGQDSVAAFLLENDADHTLPLAEGQPLFLMAIATGCPKTVKALLERGADPNMNFAFPVSDAFIRCARRGVIRWALKNDRNITPLMVAADKGVVETAHHLLRAGAKTTAWTRRTQLWPINFASRRNDVKMMRLILGKDPINEQRHIVIRLSEQKARLYDASGNEIFTTSVSTGKKGFGTPTGEYVITNKHRDWTSTLYHAQMPFFQRLSCSDFGLHQGMVPGYPASHGCIRVPAGNAAKLFTMTEAGDRVRIIP